MKWFLVTLASLGGLAVIAVLILLALGHKEGSGGLQAAVEIERPAAEVFSWLDEPSRLGRWVSWMVEVRPITAGPRRVGSRAVWVMDDPNMKRKIEIASEVTEYDPGRKLSSRIAMAGFFDGQQSYTLTSVGSGDRTRIEQRGQYVFHHWFANLLKPVVRAQAQKKLVADLARLKTLAEASPASAAAAPAAQ